MEIVKRDWSIIANLWPVRDNNTEQFRVTICTTIRCVFKFTAKQNGYWILVGNGVVNLKFSSADVSQFYWHSTKISRDCRPFSTMALFYNFMPDDSLFIQAETSKGLRGGSRTLD